MTEAGWTATKPNVAGWYWWRNEKLHFGEQICRIKFYKNKLFVYFMEGERYDLDIMKDGEWLGPITPDSYQQGRVAGIGECKDLVDSFAEAYLLASMVAHSLSPEIHKCIAEFVSSIGGEIAKLAQAAQDEKEVGDANG